MKRPGKKFLWERKSEELLQFWPKDCTQHFLSPQSDGSFFAQLGSHGKISFPKKAPINPLEAQGILNSAISTYSKGFYQSRSESEFHFVGFPTAGSGRLHFDRKTLDIRKGSFFAVPRGHAYDFSASGKWGMIWFHLAASPAWDKIVGLDISTGECSDFAKIKFAAEAYAEEMRSSSPSPEIAETYARLISLYLRRTLNCQAAKPSRLDLFMAEFGRDLSREAQTKKTAKKFGVSPYLLDKMCLERHSKNFAKTVADMRMRKAEEMLLEKPPRPLSEIAAAAGFCDSYALSKAFKRHCGVSPTAFRELA